MKKSNLSPTTRWILFLTALISFTICFAITNHVIENKWNEGTVAIITPIMFMLLLGVTIVLYYLLIVHPKSIEEK